MEKALQEIHAQYVTPASQVLKRNNKTLKWVIENIIDEMREDDFFDDYYIDTFYGGSFYDNSKVGKPNEVDIDLLFGIPCHLKAGNRPGHVKIKLEDPDCEDDEYDDIERFIDQKGYLLTSKFSNWFKSVLNKAIARLSDWIENKVYRITLDDDYNTQEFDVIIHDNGAAQNIELKAIEGNRYAYTVDIDLMPGLYFSDVEWPDFIEENPIDTNDGFWAVPKLHRQLNSVSNKRKSNRGYRYWVLSFQEKERDMLIDKNRLKPSLKLLKLIRDHWGHHEIKDYYLKTLMLHLTDYYLDEFWNGPLSDVFVTVLEEYLDTLERREDYFYYYWDSDFNFLGWVDSKRLTVITNRIRSIFNKLCDTDDPNVVYECFNIKNNA